MYSSTKSIKRLILNGFWVNRSSQARQAVTLYNSLCKGCLCHAVSFNMMQLYYLTLYSLDPDGGVHDGTFDLSGFFPSAICSSGYFFHLK